MQTLKSKNPNAIVFSTFYYKGAVETGQCQDWQRYTESAVNLPFDDLFFTSLEYSVASYDYELNYMRTNSTYSCGEISVVSRIIELLSGPPPAAASAISCSKATWNIFACSSTTVLCVNCRPQCGSPSCPAVQAFSQSILNPCQPCRSDSASYYFVSAQFATKILYPIVHMPMNVTAEKTALTIRVNVSAIGVIYCAAFAQGIPVTSALTVQQRGYRQTILAPGSVEVSVSGLSPSTDYALYCFTQDFNGHAMTLAAVAATATNASTECCHVMQYSYFPPTIYEYITGSAVSSSVFKFTLDASPTAATVVVVKLVGYQCTWSAGSALPLSAVAKPSRFSFTAATLAFSGSFIVQGSPGCYNVTVSVVSGPHYDSATRALGVVSLTLPPNPPIIQSATFSNDGQSLIVFFDSPCDATKFPSVFNCSALFTFAGSSMSTCLWATTKQVTASIGVSITLASVNIGDSVVVKGGVLFPICQSGKLCTAATRMSLVVTEPLSPTTPTVSLSAPIKIGSCDNLVMDPTATTGQAGRPWQRIIWSATALASNTKNLTTFLNKQYRSTSDLVIVPKDYLTPGAAYTISIQLTNFLGRSAVASVKVTVDSLAAIPSLTIAGPKVVTLTRPQALSLFAVATLPSCAQNSSSANTLVYTWKLYDGITYLPNLKSTSLDARFFKLPAYSLDSLTTYTVQVSVAKATAPALSLTDVSVSLQVGQSGVLAIVVGGAVRTVGYADPVLIDASRSDDIDYPGSALSFSWVCSESSPNYGSPCNSLPSPPGPTLSIKAAGNLISPTEPVTSSTSLLMQIFITNQRMVSSSAAVTIVVLQAQIPAVSIASLKAKYNPDQNILLSGSISGIQQSVTSWSCGSLSLTGIALTPLSATATAGTTVFQLAIGAGSLSPGVSYTFQLAAAYASAGAAATAAAVTSYSQVVVVMNASPRGGVLSCSPSNGTALTTSFFLLTFKWIDAPEDYPLSYVLSYFAVTAANQVVIKNADQTTYINTLLGQGLASANYYVTSLAFAIDTFGSSANTSLAVQVLPTRSKASLAAVATTQMASALSSNNPGAVSQLIGAVTSTMNSVNCSVPVACSTINRQPCSFTARTCGPCLQGFIGVFGDSNSPCGLSQNLKQIGEACAANGACVSNLCSSGVCSVQRKQCVNECSGNGICNYYDTNNLATSICAATDSFCKASCVCKAGFNGMDCSLSATSLAAAQKTRETLCVGLYNTLGIQDVSLDVITSRASSISSILLDITQITDIALGNCTAALVETILEYPTIAGSPTTFALCSSALSTVLEKGAGLPKALLASVSVALSALATGVQGNMAIGQQTQSISTSNARIAVSLVDPSALASQQFYPPQTAVEAFQVVTYSSIHPHNHPLIPETYD